MTDYKELNGKTIKSITNDGDELIFEFTDGVKYLMKHYQDCCESVRIDWGKSCTLKQLEGKTIDRIFETSSNVQSEEYCDSTTQTTYAFVTKEETFKIVWIGSSNGYYSETPTFHNEKNKYY